MSDIIITEKEQKRILPLIKIFTIELGIITTILGLELSFTLYNLIK